jgi:hypothetical protein
MNKKSHRARQKTPIRLILHRRRQAIQEGSRPLWATEGSGSRWSLAIPSAASGHYDNLHRLERSHFCAKHKIYGGALCSTGLAMASIFCCQAYTSKVADLGHLEGGLPARGEPISAFSWEHLSEHQIIHLELPTTHEPLSIVLEYLAVPCILNSILTSSLIDQVNILALELVLRSFVVYLDTERAHANLWWEDGLRPVHHEERCLACGSTR